MNIIYCLTLYTFFHVLFHNLIEIMSNKSVRISDKLIQWETEKNPLAPLTPSQINAYLSISEYLGNTDFIVSVYTSNLF